MTIWDRSVEQWQYFIGHSFAYQQSMAELAAEIAEHQPRCFIDLCCGTACLSARLRELLPDCKIVFADHSAHMLAAGQRALGTSGAAVQIDLTACPPPGATGPGLPRDADCLACHCALPLEPGNDQALHNFLATCSECLRPGGRLFLRLNNTCTAIDGDPYDPEHDVFRQLLERLATELGVSGAMRRDPPRKLTPMDISRAIERSGTLEEESKQHRSYPFTMAERLNLWRVPAILDTLFRLDRVDTAVLARLYERLERELPRSQTADVLTVTYVVSRQP